MIIPKVSVIIPVYNTEKYVKDAILSIINQTLKEIEILVINDGSTDNSLQIITEIAKKDNRMQIFSQENKGQSIARNVGIEKARGEYIYFMDSDDLLDLEALECCYNKCEVERLDFVFFDADIICEKKELSFSIEYYRPEIDEKVYNGVYLLNDLIDKHLYRVAPWMSFIRLSFLYRINLKFYPGIIHEDELFSTILYTEAERVGRIEKKFFRRRIREDSTMTKQYSLKNIEGYFTVIEQLNKYIEKKPQYIKNIIQKYLKIMLNIIIRNASSFSANKRLNILTHCIKYKYIKKLHLKTILIFIFRKYLP